MYITLHDMCVPSNCVNIKKKQRLISKLEDANLEHFIFGGSNNGNIVITPGGFLRKFS